MNEVALASKDSIVGSVMLRAIWLIHYAFGFRAISTDLHLPSGELDEEQHHEPLQSLWRPYLDSEEVSGGDQLPMLRQEFFPRRSLFVIGRGLDSRVAPGCRR